MLFICFCYCYLAARRMAAIPGPGPGPRRQLYTEIQCSDDEGSTIQEMPRLISSPQLTVLDKKHEGFCGKK